jgi:hypothetical protein
MEEGVTFGLGHDTDSGPGGNPTPLDRLFPALTGPEDQRLDPIR